MREPSRSPFRWHRLSFPTLRERLPVHDAVPIVKRVDDDQPQVPVTRARTIEPLDRRDAIGLTALVAATIGIPLWLAASAGAIGVPSGDDWVYIKGAESLFRSGSVNMPGHTAASLGQLVMVQPFLWLSGDNPWAFTAFDWPWHRASRARICWPAFRGGPVMVALLLVLPGAARRAPA
jgi:hypothetical protein